MCVYICYDSNFQISYCRLFLGSFLVCSYLVYGIPEPSASLSVCLPVTAAQLSQLACERGASWHAQSWRMGGREGASYEPGPYEPGPYELFKVPLKAI